MKKLITLIIASALMLSLASCGRDKGDEDTNGTGNVKDTATQTDTPSQGDSDTDGNTDTDGGMNDVGDGAEDTSEGPLALLEKVWSAHGENEKFPVAGGDMSEENMSMDGPGIYGLEDTEALDATLGFPAASVTDITSAASLMHMMNANTFTCGAYETADGTDAEALAEEIKNNITGRQWMCGFPDKLVIAVADGTVVSFFGNGEIVDTFKDHLTSVVDGAEIVCEESLA